MMKYRNDIALICVLLVLSAASLSAAAFYKNAEADVLEIYGDGKLVYSLPIGQAAFLLLTAENGVYELKQFSSKEDACAAAEAADHYNLIAVGHGKAWVCEADCRGRDCVRQKALDGGRESIICLPHKMLICLRAAGEDPLDAVTW